MAIARVKQIVCAGTSGGRRRPWRGGRLLPALVAMVTLVAGSVLSASPASGNHHIDGPVRLFDTSGGGALNVNIGVGEYVETSEIPPTELPGLADAIPAAPLGSIPLGSIPLGSIPLGSIPLGSIPLGSIPLGSIPLGSIPLGSIPLGSIGGWEAALAGIPEFDRPLQTITLGELLAYIQANPGSPLAAISLGDLDLTETPLGSIGLASMALGPLPLGSIPLAEGAGSEAERMALWCALLDDFGILCEPAGPIRASSTVLTLDVLGVPLGSIPLGSIPLGSIPLASIPLGSIPLGSIPLGSIGTDATPLGSIPLGSIPLGSIPLGSIPLGSIPLGSIGDIVDCNLVDCTNGTLADAEAAGAILDGAQLWHLAAVLDAFTLADLDGAWPDDFTLGDLLVSLVDPADFPWEDLPLLDLGLQQWHDPAGASVPIYQLFLDEGGPAVFEDVNVEVEQPPSLRFRRRFGSNHPLRGIVTLPDNSTYEVTDATIDGPLGRLSFGDLPAGSMVEIRMYRTDPLVEMSGQLRVTAWAGSFKVTQLKSISSSVGPNEACNATPVLTPGCASFADRLSLQPGRLMFGTSGPGDEDYYRVPAPPPGFRLSVYVTGMGDDHELALFQAVPAGPLTGEVGQSDIGAVPVTEQSRERVAAAGDLTGDAAGEFITAGLRPIAISDRAGLADELVSTIADGSASEYVVRVTGSENVAGHPGYMVRSRYVPIPAEASCDPPSFAFAGQGTPGSLPASLPNGVNTLFLVNRQRMGDTYGPGGAASTIGRLNGLAGRADLGVVGAVIPVEGNASVASAYAAWDQDPCSTSAANNVVSAVSQAVDGLLAANPGAADTVESVVLVGGDNLIPMARVPDVTHKANEYSYSGDLRAGDGSATPLSASAETRNTLTDDPYGDVDPIPFFERHLYVPDRAVGRLVETPTEIQTAIDQFETHDGILDASTALTTGYDFLADGADAIDQGLARRLADGQRQVLNPETWTRDDLDAALFPAGADTPGIASVNAHYDHNKLLPGVPTPYGDDDLYTTADLEAAGLSRLAGKLLFTMGCHGGTNVPDIYVGETSADSFDWAQATAGAGGSFVGNTGYGLGDTATVALSERLMALYAERLDGNRTVGQALSDAKQAYLGGLGAYGGYDEKVLMQVAFYGLPMYRIGEPTAPPLPSASPPPATSPDPLTGIEAASLSASPTFVTVAAPDGSTFVRAGDSEPQTTVDRPIVPRTAWTFDASGPQLRGAVITSLESTRETGVTNTVASPVLDTSTGEPAGRFDNVAFPAQFASVNRFRASGGEEQSLVLLPARFTTDDDPNTPVGTGTRELFTDVEVTAYFSDDPDNVPPVVNSAIASVQEDGTTTFTVRAADRDHNGASAGTARSAVMYRSPNGGWNALNLFYDSTDASGTDTWSRTVNIGAGATGVEWFVQVVDQAGQVSVHANHGRMIRTSRVAPSFELGNPISAALGEAVELSFDVTDPDSTRFTATADWGEGTTAGAVSGSRVTLNHLTVRPGPQTVEVTVCDDGGQCTTKTLGVTVIDPSIDTTPPVVTGVPDRAPNSHGWYNAPVTIDWQSVDPEPSSGTPTDPPDTVVVREGADVRHASLPSCDPRGNCASGSTRISLDATAPTVGITTGLIAPLFGRMQGVAGDGLAGVDTVSVTYQPVLVGATRKVDVTLSCSADRRTCTWSAALPPLGLYTVTATATDRAGNVASVSSSLVVVLF